MWFCEVNHALVLDKLAHEVAAREAGDGRLQERIEDGKRLCVEGEEQLLARMEAQILVLEEQHAALQKRIR